METRVTKWVDVSASPDGDYAAYRIWQQTDGRRWWQRHEWRKRDGRTLMDDWIDATAIAGWCVDAVPAFDTEPTPEGNQYVITGCEKDKSRGPSQMDLF